MIPVPVKDKSKYYESMAEKRSPYYEETNSALEIVKQFIIDKQLIVYGGMSIDLSLKIAYGDERAGIYDKEVIPDYDFFSSDPYKDSIELADILIERGFTNVSAINALHITTRRVRVNFITVADIGFIPKNIFEKVPYIVWNKIRVVHPYQQFLDIHRELLLPLEGPPMETFFFRSKKSIARYRLLDKAYPIENFKDFDKIPEVSVTLHDIFKGIINGYFAYAFYSKIYEEFASHKIKPQISIEIVKNTEKTTRAITLTGKMINPRFTVFSNEYVPGDKDTVLERWLDNLRPKCIKLHDSVLEIYVADDIYIGYQVWKDYKIISVQGALLFMIQQWRETSHPAYINYYNALKQMVIDAETFLQSHLPCDGCDKCRAARCFMLPTQFYGNNVGDVYKDFVRETRYKIDNTPHEERLVGRPPRGYYGSDDPPDFDYSKSEFFQIDGEPIK